MNRQKLATPREAAEHLQVSEKTLRNWRSLRIGPRSSKVGGRVRYRWEDLDRWFDSRARGAA